MFSLAKLNKRKKWRTWLRNIKQTKKCTKCGETNYKTLDWHHIKEKGHGNTVARMVHQLKPKRLIKKEMRKCIILCANCHIIHHQGVNHFKLRHKSKLVRLILNIKNNSKCYFCNIRIPTLLRFHHLENKKFNIGNAVRSNRSEAEIVEELRKCLIVCANCHRKIH